MRKTRETTTAKANTAAGTEVGKKNETKRNETMTKNPMCVRAIDSFHIF